MAVTTIKYGRATSIGGGGSAGAPGTNYSGEPNGDFQANADGAKCNPVSSDVLNDKTLTDEKIRSITNWGMNSIANIKVSKDITFNDMLRLSSQRARGVQVCPFAKIQCTQQQIAMNMREVAVTCIGPILCTVPKSALAITSSHRDFQPNLSAGSTVAKKGGSQHNIGAAADLQWGGRSKLVQLAQVAQASVPKYGQLILENKNGCVHISSQTGTSRRNQCMSTGGGAKIGQPANPTEGKNGYSKNMGSSSRLLVDGEGKVAKKVA